MPPALNESGFTMRRDTVLALAGGAAYGIAHIGVLEALEEAGFRVSGIAGTSVGALVGTLYAFGQSVPELKEQARRVRWPALTRPSLPHLGLLSMRPLRAAVRDAIGDVDLRDAPIPLRLVATDLATGAPFIFSEGPADLAVLASCSIPGLIQPVKWKERLLVDGGLVDNLPVELARQLGGGPVIAVDFQASRTHPDPENILEVILRSVDIMINLTSRRERAAADLSITPEVGAFAIADLSKADELLEAGYFAARMALEAAGWTG